jgi:hypothetical protein
MPGAKAVRGYAERLLKDIDAARFARKPVVNGAALDINHPAFVYGHLALYPMQLAEMLDLPRNGMEIPASYPELFRMGVACQDDPKGEIYPSMQELTTTFFTATDALFASIHLARPELFEVELENPSRRERFQTVGPFVAYILLAHPQVHLGQVSAWRRCMGLGAA